MESRSFPFSCDEAGRFAERRTAQTTANRVAGYTLSAVSIGSKLINGENISTAEGVGFGVSTALVGAAWIAAGTVAAPFVAAGALIYGASEFGSYMFTGNTLEENILGK
jgi:methylaspartate ammonia-lyase